MNTVIIIVYQMGHVAPSLKQPTKSAFPRGQVSLWTTKKKLGILSIILVV